MSNYVLTMQGAMLDTTRMLEQFLAGVERRAYRMAVVATGLRDEALEIVQDSMTKLVQRYRDKDPTEWGPLFQMILQSTIRDWYRRRKVRNTVMQWVSQHSSDEDDEDVIEGYADPVGQSPEQQTKTAQAMVKLQQALRELPLRQQQAFLLRQWEGLDVLETARAMQVSEGSVKTHYSRAIQSLREKLEGYWP